MHLRYVFALLLVACVPAPDRVTERAVALDIAKHFDAVYPRASFGLLRPRFGAPVIAQRSEHFEIVVLAGSSTAPVRAALVRSDVDTPAAGMCLGEAAGSACIPLRLEARAHESVDAAYALTHYAAAAALAPGIYDLIVERAGEHDRARRAVVLMDDDPRAPRDLRVVQLTDLHVGKAGHVAEIAARLEVVIRTVNRLAPDLVIVTGDMADQGRTLALEEQAANALLRIEAPVLAILGNHDYGHFPTLFRPSRSAIGYYNFARAFHALKLFEVELGGWAFVGFDSGRSLFSPRIDTRGVLPETVALLREAATHGRRGVVFFSHAPTRAELDSNPRHTGSNSIGSMRDNASALEAMMREVARAGRRVLHLSGHTHWADLFVEHGNAFSRVPFAELHCTVVVDAPVALVNTPAAAFQTFHVIEHGDLSGFTLLTLRAHDESVRYVLHDGAKTPCAPSPDDDAVRDF